MMKTTVQRQKEYRKRLKEQGLTRVEVWVKPEQAKLVREYAKELCFT